MGWREELRLEDSVLSRLTKNVQFVVKIDVREQVFRLIADPFIISGTLRINVDPYNEYRDRDILRMMDLINIKKYIP